MSASSTPTSMGSDRPIRSASDPDIASTMDGTPRPRSGKSGYTKSRYGCRRCRMRRVKVNLHFIQCPEHGANLDHQCNEERPTCQSCKRHNAECVYDRIGPLQSPVVSISPSQLPSKPDSQHESHSRPQLEQQTLSELRGKSRSPSTARSRSGSVQARVVAALTGGVDTSLLSDPPESRERRMLEAKLMRHYVLYTGKTVAIDEISMHHYRDLVPQLALTSEGLMYCMYSLAAYHCVLRGDNDGPPVGHAYRRYLSMGLREHSRSVPAMTMENTDAFILTSSLLRAASFIMLQERNRQPYTLPAEWLMMNASTKAIVDAAYRLTLSQGQSVAIDMVARCGVVKNFAPIKHRHFGSLVQREDARDANERWDEETRSAYEIAERQLESAAEATREGKLNDALRRLVVFPMLMEPRFVELVQKEEPRAAICLAHYFALLSLHTNRWWIGNVGAAEVLEMSANTTGPWQKMLEWPMQVVSTGSLPPVLRESPEEHQFG